MIDESNIRTGQTEYQVVAFSLGNEDYATPISHVKEVINPKDYIRIPEAPKYIKGVINLRGSIIPVIDGRIKFNMEVQTRQTHQEEKIMIIETYDGTVGLIVDNVTGVVRLGVEDIQQPPANLGENSEIFWGLGKHNDKLLILIDCQKSLNLTEEIKDFKNITEIVKSAQNEPNSE